MKAEIKQQWLAALRSGKYKQTKGVLRTTDGFCCLGVLCDIVDPSGWAEINVIETSIGGEYTERDAYVYQVGDSCAATTLPHQLRERIGLRLPDVKALIDMNDSGRRFVTIAKHIEANIPGE